MRSPPDTPAGTAFSEPRLNLNQPQALPPAAQRLLGREVTAPAPLSRRDAKAKPQGAVATFLRILEEKEGSALKAWFRHFDVNQNCRVDHREFVAGLESIKYQGNVDGLWDALDSDKSGEIILEEIDAKNAESWNNLRRWCGMHFQGGRDMINRLKAAVGHGPPDDRLMAHGLGGSKRRVSNPAVLDDRLTEAEFTDGLQALGYEGGSEHILFHGLDVEDENLINIRELKWLEIEARRFKQKQQAKNRAARLTQQKLHQRKQQQQALRDFKGFLRHHYGCLFRAWRGALDLDSSMSVQRAELFRACRQLSWRGDVRALWRALDHDGSGVTTLEELDPHCARLLAQFKQWAEDIWGPKPSVAMFKALDRNRTRKLRYGQFVEECEHRGFRQKVRTLAMWFDWQDHKVIVEEDLSILDAWRPPAYLMAEPNEKAAETFKEQLLQKHGHFIKAWRKEMDRDNSNSCSWHEFVEAAKKIKFVGDVAGAWLAFDENLNGHISLREISSSAHAVLTEFKRWADEEFGSVRTAFKVLDADSSNDLTYREFRGAVRNFGFIGDAQTLFKSLDQEGASHLSPKEVVFLDDWDTRGEATDFEDEQEGDNGPAPGPEMPASRLDQDFQTPGPGPGAYDIRSLIGASPLAPFAKHCGTWSFTKRPKARTKRSVGPGNYDPNNHSSTPTKPAYSFGSSGAPSRAAAYATKLGTSSDLGSVVGPRRPQPASPGPGAYEVSKTAFQGPRFSVKARRTLNLPKPPTSPEGRRQTASNSFCH